MLSKAGIQKSNTFLGGEVLTHLTTDIVLKAVDSPVEPSLDYPATQDISTQPSLPLSF